MGGFLSKIFSKNSFGEQEIANEIIATSMVCGQAYVDSCSENRGGEEDLSEHVNEFIYFFLHNINRAAYSKGGKSAQEAIYNKVLEYVVTALVIGLESEYRSTATEYHIARIAESENLYGGCIKFVAEDGEGMANTLLWEAAKRVAKSEDISKIMMAAELIFSGMKTLRLNDKVNFVLIRLIPLRVSGKKICHKYGSKHARLPHKTENRGRFLTLLNREKLLRATTG